MPSPEDVFEEIERDRSVREREIRLVGNSARKTENTDERDMFLRTAVLLTYAHFEGFCKFALENYVAAVNSVKISCSQAAYVLVAATLTDVFAALRNPSNKHDYFANPLPDDAKLHLLARESEFVEKYETIVQSHINLPDKVIDTESNLSPVVLKKNLYKLGMNYAAVDAQKAAINRLLGTRNAIAHGDMLKIPSSKDVEEYVAVAFRVMRFVQNEIFFAMKRQVYRRA